MENLYDIIGVKKEATMAEIKRAYKKRASQYHPDKNQDDPEATIKFQALAKAYDILSNPDKRERYDKTGEIEDGLTTNELANDTIARVFLQIAEKSDFEPQNYLNNVTKSIQNALRQCMVDKRRFDKSFEKLEYIILNTTADELFLCSLNRKLQEIKHNKAHADQGILVMNKALELLDNYKYTGKVPKQKEKRPWLSTTDPYIS